jgi:hypothetical protein
MLYSKKISAKALYWQQVTKENAKANIKSQESNKSNESK